ncbi:META domain-containing protein [Psychromonas sp. RZ22]|uniref:YbaY family lipoprotein n=1 Tax=Psychromonas algarum TaxID=2555643 RepID=UPI0010687D8C|nr:YbaY family lipoprotein [Psychromonas sp. RZ22]TEW55966.1 META domain-containing protein [Psychromonas sp. RZ22]
MFNWKLIALCCVLLGITACSSAPKSSIISGTVTYHERIALPENAVLSIKLEDTAKQDVAAFSVAEKSMTVNTAPPWNFELSYSPKKLDKKGHYTLRASIKVDGKIRFINTTSTPAFDNKEAINIVLSPAGQQIEIDNQTMLQAHPWVLTEVNKIVVEPAAAADKAVGISFNQKSKRAAGFAGCNQFSGGYEVTESTLTFAPLISTQMACLNGDDEFNYLQALSHVETYKINGSSLTMSNKLEQVILRFKVNKSIQLSNETIKETNKATETMLDKSKADTNKQDDITVNNKNSEIKPEKPKLITINKQ